VSRVIAILHILRIVQILKDALAEGDAVLIDEDIWGRVCCEVIPCPRCNASVPPKVCILSQG